MFDSTDSLDGGNDTFTPVTEDGVAIASNDPSSPVYISQTSQELQILDENVSALTDIALEMRRTGLISRSSMENARVLATTFESFQELENRYPVESFTGFPTAQNINPALEGILNTIKEATVKGIKLLWKIIRDLVKAAIARLKYLSKDLLAWLTKSNDIKSAELSVASLREKARQLDDAHVRGLLNTELARYNDDALLLFMNNYHLGIAWILGQAPEISQPPQVIAPALARATARDSDILKMSSKLMLTDFEKYERKISKINTTKNFARAEKAIIDTLEFSNRPIEMFKVDPLLEAFALSDKDVSHHVKLEDERFYYQNIANGVLYIIGNMKENKSIKPGDDILTVSSNFFTNDGGKKLIDLMEAARAKSLDNIVAYDKDIEKIEKLCESIVAARGDALDEDSLKVVLGVVHEIRDTAAGVDQLVDSVVCIYRYVAQAQALEVKRLQREVLGWRSVLSDKHIAQRHRTAIEMSVRDALNKIGKLKS